MPSPVHDVLIVGGGLQGCAIALCLARAGKRAVVIEQQMAGRHASGVNAGGLRTLMRDLREYPLAMRARQIWGSLADHLGSAPAAAACEVRLGTGQIALAMDHAELDWAAARAADMQHRGIHTESLIGPGALHRLLPGLSKAALGGLITQGDGHANPAMAARAFRDAAEAAGATILENRTVQDLTPVTGGGWRAVTSAGDIGADQAVNAAGAWGGALAERLGETLPVSVLALSMMVTARIRPFVTPVVIGIDQPLSFKQTAAGSLVIGGGISGKPCLQDRTSFTIMERLAGSAAATVAAFPALANVPILRTWTGLEAATPDGVPYIGPSALHPGLWHVFGFCGHGFLLGPAVGEAVADALIHGTIDPMLRPFAPGRFAAGLAA